MRIVQYHFNGVDLAPPQPQAPVSLFLIFGSRSAVTAQRRAELQQAFPAATIVGCTSAGQIMGADLFDEGAVITALSLEHGHTRAEWGALADYAAPDLLGEALVERLLDPALRHLMILSDGLGLPAEELLRGIDRKRPAGVSLSGGCAGDGDRFGATEVWLGANGGSGGAVLLGFYGDGLMVHCQQGSGWEGFGPERRITRAVGTTLYELDGGPALALYKRYLGDLSSQLPTAAWRYPLGISSPGDDSLWVRSLLSFDETEQSMTFASAMAAGDTVQLMRAGMEQLLDAARDATASAHHSVSSAQGDVLALVISCFGRRVLLGQRTFEELEVAQEALAIDAPFCGFYSYGEMANASGGRGRLLNQSFTLTLIAERGSSD